MADGQNAPQGANGAKPASQQGVGGAGDRKRDRLTLAGQIYAAVIARTGVQQSTARVSVKAADDLLAELDKPVGN